MEKFICRTCLKPNLTKNNSINIFNKTDVNQRAMKDMLETFMPEMDLDISEGETDICLPCSEFLKTSYMFRNVCLRTEEKIYDYLHQYNIPLGRKINLNVILDHKVVEINFGSDMKYDSELHSKFMQECNTESNQSKSDNFVPSESEEEVAKPLKTRRRKRAKNPKTQKSCNYNSQTRSYTCDLCEYKAYRIDLLNAHKLKHDANIVTSKEYKCNYCTYRSSRKRALDRHLFTHKGKSQHLCEICNKLFAEKYQLKLHMLTHTGQELPHKCSECGKGFLTKSYLKQHMETNHLAKKKKSCKECDEDIRCEHGFNRFYKCNMCELSFSDKRGLDAHKFTHTGGDFPFKCSQCSFSTAWKGNLKKHLQNKH